MIVDGDVEGEGEETPEDGEGEEGPAEESEPVQVKEESSQLEEDYKPINF